MTFYTSFIDELEKLSGIGQIRPMTQKDARTFGLRSRVKFNKPWEHRIMVSQDGGVMGYTSYDPKEKELHRLWVHPDYRRKGVATSLMKALPSKAEWLNVKPGNKRAKKFYSSLGYPMDKTAADMPFPSQYKRSLLQGAA